MKKTFKIIILTCLIATMMFLITSCDGFDSFLKNMETPSNSSSMTHIAVMDSAVSPTNISDGLTEGWHCAICGEILVEQQKIPAHGTPNLAYRINTDRLTCTITGLGSCTDDVICIGAYIDGYKVVAINANAFTNCNHIKEFRFAAGSSVTSIGAYAFANCSNLMSITIPDSVTSIGSSAFSNCNSLTSIIIPDSVTFIGSSAFSLCNNLTKVTLGTGITSINDYTFSRCINLTEITIPENVTNIGSYAFQYCNKLTSITIPKNVRNIGSYAFEYCYSLEKIIFEESKYIWQFNVNKGSVWNSHTGNYTVYCTDGTISKY